MFIGSRQIWHTHKTKTNKQHNQKQQQTNKKNTPYKYKKNVDIKQLLNYQEDHISFSISVDLQLSFLLFEQWINSHI